MADFDGSESATALAAVEAARTIRAGAGRLGPDDVDVKVNVGLHWGATLMVGQVATRGRLEVTALGDQMNEAARIEAAAKRRDDPGLEGPRRTAGVPRTLRPPGSTPRRSATRRWRSSTASSAKVIRDAGAIAVAQL